MKTLDLTGQRFGRLTAVSFSRVDHHQKRLWWWQCDCGQRKEINHSLVRQGRISSCGCLAKELLTQRLVKDIAGQRFGRLVALRQTGRRIHGMNMEWEFRCDCGALTYTSSPSVKSGNTNSCGCYLKDRITETQRNELTGQRFGRLVAVEFSHNITKANGNKGQACWRFDCDCGGQVVASGAVIKNRALRNGDVGCQQCAKQRMAATRSDDYTGKRFGMLTGIKQLDLSKSPAFARWLWQCACGKQVDRLPGNVKTHPNANCGCSRVCTAADRTGERFGSLVALERLRLDKAGKTYVWRFQCDCGNLCEARLRDAVKGRQQSCGCRMGGYDSISGWIDGTFRNPEAAAFLYVFPLAKHEGYAKPGIAESLEIRKRGSRGQYGEVHDFIELPRLDAWLIEQATLHATKYLAGCPAVLADAKWEGYTEVRQMEPAAAFQIALDFHSQLQDLGREEFAIRFLPMTPAEQRALIRMAA
jgi:hypothetical protein